MQRKRHRMGIAPQQHARAPGCGRLGFDWVRHGSIGFGWVRLGSVGFGHRAPQKLFSSM